MSTNSEQIKFSRITTSFGRLTWLHARYISQSFARHFHEDFPIGVVEKGALKFYYRGENVVAPVGSINLANPGEIHTGLAATEFGWTYRMFYFDLELIQKLFSEMTGGPPQTPFFKSGVIHDSPLAAQIRGLHLLFERNRTPLLELESRLLCILRQLITRYADQPVSSLPVKKNHPAAKRVQDYIAAHCSEELTLENLAQVAGLSPFHMIRVFEHAIGLAPHAYLTQCRINRAKNMLAKNFSLTDTAYELGFVDQSHFHKRFKTIVGMTPGKYRKNIQDTALIPH